MVYVGFIGWKGIPIFKKACQEYTEGVENGDHHDSDRDGRRCMNGPVTPEGDIEFVKLDRHYRHDKSQHQGACVAHEYLVCLSKYIEKEKGQQGTHQRCRHDGPVVFANQVEPCAKGERYQHTEAGREAINAIHEVETISDAYDGDESEQDPDMVGKFPYPQEAMQVGDEDTAKDNRNDNCNKLGHQFFKGSDADDVVFEACEKDDKKSGDGILKFWKIAEIEEDQQRDGHAVEDGQSA